MCLLSTVNPMNESVAYNHVLCSIVVWWCWWTVKHYASPHFPRQWCQIGLSITAGRMRRGAVACRRTWVVCSVVRTSCWIHDVMLNDRRDAHTYLIQTKRYFIHFHFEMYALIAGDSAIQWRANEFIVWNAQIYVMLNY